MFLDDKLLKMCREVACNTEEIAQEAIQELNISLCTACNEHFESQLSPKMTGPEIRAALDKTFNLWNSFVRMGLSDSNQRVVILSQLFKDHSFKRQLLNNEKIAALYNSLK